eukprot:TRINITY_DN9189_c0_g1_i1.p1 TRINITY_DN9189_c0_g1~~TRINITY_DN9189_c0_g1_i1.p1  ORF type:complete len:193 (+),score=34.05 TRINITY_DN9189_c0_g1_i1:263-841(+)
MKLAIILVLCVAAYTFGQTPTRPKISEVFEADGRVEWYAPQRNFSGAIHWRADQPAGKSITEEIINIHPVVNTINLQRFDIGKVYDYDSNLTSCRVTDEGPGPMPTIWGWIEDAIFEKEVHEKNRIIDVWVQKKGRIVNWIGVDQKDTTKPIFFEYLMGEVTTVMYFENFQTNKPEDTWFTVPSICNPRTLR